MSLCSKEKKQWNPEVQASVLHTLLKLTSSAGRASVFMLWIDPDKVLVPGPQLFRSLLQAKVLVWGKRLELKKDGCTVVERKGSA